MRPLVLAYIHPSKSNAVKTCHLAFIKQNNYYKSVQVISLGVQEIFLLKSFKYLLSEAQKTYPSSNKYKNEILICIVYFSGTIDKVDISF